MLGNIKKKLINLIDRRVEQYLNNNPAKDSKDALEVYDNYTMSYKERKDKNELRNNIKYSIQRGFDSLVFSQKGQNVAMDSQINPKTMHGLYGSPKDIVFSFFTKFGFIGYQICSILGQHWLISNACSIPNQDCIRNGWQNIFVQSAKDKNQSNSNKDSEEENKKERLQLLSDLYNTQQKKYQLNDKLLLWGYYRNLHGTSYLLPQIDGIDYEKPFNIDGVKKGSFKGISVIEPYWMIPDFDYDNFNDPTNPNFMQPEYYKTSTGNRIHKSHFIVGRRKYVSDILKPTYYFGGISLAQEIYERVYASEKSANEAPLLLLTKRLNVYQIDLKKFFTDPSYYERQAKLLTETRDNQGILYTDHRDTLQQIDTSLGDLEQVISGQFSLVAAIARIPVDKLMEQNPTGGLSSNGSYNVKNYNQDLNTLQTSVFEPAIDRINQIVLKSDFDCSDKVAITFNPTDNPTDQEIAELNKLKADTTAIYLQTGVITPEEARMKLTEDKTAGYSFLKGMEEDEPTEEEKKEIENLMNGAKGDEDTEDNDNNNGNGLFESQEQK